MRDDICGGTNKEYISCEKVVMYEKYPIGLI
jgi:hypothetical protein